MNKKIEWNEERCEKVAIKRASGAAIGIQMRPKGEYESEESYRARIAQYAIAEYKSLISQLPHD